MYRTDLAEIRKWRDRAASLRAEAQRQDNSVLLRTAEDYERMADHEERMLAKYSGHGKAA